MKKVTSRVVQAAVPAVEETTIMEVEGGGLVKLLGQNVLIFCMNYIYTGELTGVNSTCIQLTKAKIVYETGPFGEEHYKDAQALPGDGTWYIQTAAIESFGPGK